MTSFSISLAGIVVDVSAVYPSTKDFCNEFLTQKSSDFTVNIHPEDIEHVRSISGDSGTPAYLETLALLRKISEEFINYNTILFHGSALAVNGKAYIFTARSGTGKTTHSRLWLNKVPGSYMLNGDKPFLRIIEGKIMVCGSPWKGKENYGVNEILPLEAICILERDSYDHIEQITYNSALSTLIQQTYRPENASLLMKSVQLIGNVAQSVRLYRLGCTMNPKAALVSSQAMIK